MSVRPPHVAPEQLAALAVAAGAGTLEPEDRAALDHATACAECGSELARLTAAFDDLRDEADADVAGVFDELALAGQRERILDRIARLGQAARVLPFPAAGPGAEPAARPSRRWITAAAAAGLLIGILAGQVLHFLPGDGLWHPAPAEQGAVAPAPAPTVTASPAPLSDEELLDEIEAAVQLRRAAELRALDALTPTAAGIQ